MAFSEFGDQALPLIIIQRKAALEMIPSETSPLFVYIHCWQTTPLRVMCALRLSFDSVSSVLLNSPAERSMSLAFPDEWRCRGTTLNRPGRNFLTFWSPQVLRRRIAAGTAACRPSKNSASSPVTRPRTISHRACSSFFWRVSIGDYHFSL